MLNEWAKFEFHYCVDCFGTRKTTFDVYVMLEESAPSRVILFDQTDVQSSLTCKVSVLKWNLWKVEDVAPAINPCRWSLTLCCWNHFFSYYHNFYFFYDFIPSPIDVSSLQSPMITVTNSTDFSHISPSKKCPMLLKKFW